MGEGEVQRPVFQDESNILIINRSGEIVDFPDRQSVVAGRALFRRGAGFGTHQDLVGKTCFHDLVVVVLDDGIGMGIHLGRGFHAMAHGDGRFHIEQPVDVRDGDGDVFRGHQFLGAGDGAGGNALEDFQPLGGVAADGTEGRGDGETDHPGTGDSHSHPVLQDVPGHFHGDAEIGRLPPEGAVAAMGTVLGNDVHGLCDGKGDGDGFRAAQGGLHFLVDQADDVGLAVSHGFSKCGSDTNVTPFWSKTK